MPNLKAEYYFGNLENLYNKHYLGLDHTWKQPEFSVNSRFKYFNAQDTGNNFEIDAQNVGLLETLKIKTIALVSVTSKLLVSLLTRFQTVSCQKLILLTGIPPVSSSKMKSHITLSTVMILKTMYRA